jgi:hypothetical protein
MLEEQFVAADRVRAARYEDRVRFHDELRQILASEAKHPGADIDALVKRQRGDHDPRIYAKARVLWRNKQVPMASRVSQIRALDIPESDILNFMSDNLYDRMHRPGGPRDDNELRVRAARLLLSCELSNETAPPAAPAERSGVVKQRRTAEARPR